MGKAQERFEKIFDEWATEHPQVFRLFDMPSDQLHAIAGYFYHQGGTDAIREARAVLNNTKTIEQELG